MRKLKSQGNMPTHPPCENGAETRSFFFCRINNCNYTNPKTLEKHAERFMQKNEKETLQLPCAQIAAIAYKPLRGGGEKRVQFRSTVRLYNLCEKFFGTEKVANENKPARADSQSEMYRSITRP